MIEYSATINGLDKLQKQLEKAPALVLAETQRAVNRSLATYQATARQLAPVDTSRLRNSITVKPATVEGTKVTGELNATAPYAAIQEGGSGIYGPHKRPIRPKNKKVLVWKDKAGQTHIAKQVKGVRGKFYMKGALETHQRDTDAYFAQAVENVARAISEGGSA